MPSPRTRPATVLLLASALAVVGLGPAAVPAAAATIPVGAGSYSDTRPAGTSGPTTNTGTPVTPKVTAAARNRPVPTNDWWSSLAFQRYGDNPYSTPMYGHPSPTRPPPADSTSGTRRPRDHRRRPPVRVRPQARPHHRTDRPQLPRHQGRRLVRLDGHPYWSDGTRTLRTTIGHGSPFVYAKGSGGNAQITTAGTPAVFADQGNVLGITVAGHHYALFAPTGSDWNVSGSTVTAGLGGKDYFSVAVLPSTDALATFRKYAYSFVTDSKVTWSYSGGTVRATYALTTEAKEGTERGTLQALYRHQWLHTTDALTSYTYVSPRGTMKVREGTSFSTSQKAAAVLPALPKSNGVDTARLRGYLNDVVNASDPFSGAVDTYWTGKALGRLAQLVPVADQIGETGIRDRMLNLMKGRLQDWFTAGGANEFSYDQAWKTLTGYPASYGSDTELNDHHFHYGYYVYAAAIIAQYDPSWAADSAWGGMVKTLVRDTANPSRTDSAFPFLRGFDVYAGHGWASGHQGFAAGNNQESSSESTNLSAALILWGSATGDTSLRDLGSFLLTTESESIAQYWFDADEQVFPSSFGHDTAGMVWGSGAAYSTWWTANPEEIHGINVLPVTGGSLHLGGEKAAIRRNIAEMERENGGPAVEWRDILWEFESFADPASAKAKWDAGNGGYTPEQGESKAHTYHWLTTLDSVGAPDATVTGDIPTSAVFTKGTTRTYVAHNHGSSARTVTFSDGKTMSVPARSTATSTGTGSSDPDPDPEPPTGNTFQLRAGGVLTTATGGTAGSDTIPLRERRQPRRHPVPAARLRGARRQRHPDLGRPDRLPPPGRRRHDGRPRPAGAGELRLHRRRQLRPDGDVPLLRDRPGDGLGGVHPGPWPQVRDGLLSTLRNGTVRLEVWSAIGNGASKLQTGTDKSVLVIPYS